MFTYQNVVLPYSIICCIKLLKNQSGNQALKNSGSQTFKNNKSAKLLSRNRHESNQNKHKFCKETKPPNLFKQ